MNLCDNYCDSFDTIEEAVRVAFAMIALLKRGDFHLCQWTSNTREVLAMLLADDLNILDLDLDTGALPEERTLDFQYRPEKDVFGFKFLKR